MALICPFWTNYVKTVEACPSIDFTAFWVDEDHDTLFPAIDIDRIGTAWSPPTGLVYPQPYAGPSSTGWVTGVGPYTGEGVNVTLHVIVDAGPGAALVSWEFVGANEFGEVVNGSLIFGGLSSVSTVGSKSVLEFIAISSFPDGPDEPRVGEFQVTPSISGTPGAPLTLHVRIWNT